MTPQRVKELLPVLQAFAEGKTIQRRQGCTTDWCDWIANFPSHDPTGEYRVKPEPRVFWIARYKGNPQCSGLAYLTIENAEKHGPICEVIKVMEVI